MTNKRSLLSKQIKKRPQQTWGQGRPNSPVPWQIWHPFLVLVLALLLSAIPVAIGASGLSELSASFLSFFIQDATFFLVPLFIVCAYYKCSPALLGMWRISLWQVVRVAIPAGVVLYLLNLAASFIINVLFPGKIAASQDVINLFTLAQNPLDIIILVIFICVLAPLAEEMLFRAFLYPPTKRLCGRTWGIILSGVVFAVIHMNIWTFLPLLVGGMGFAWLYDRYGSLWINVVAHTVWNTIVLILYFILG